MLLSLMNALFLEVMDKESSLVQIWLESLVLGIGGFLLSRYRHWLVLVPLPIALLVAWLQISELRDPVVGPQILREAGHGYVVQSYIAVAIAVVLPPIGAILGWKRFAKRAT